MLAGAKGEAYNIADSQSDISLRELAQLVANFNGTQLRFELPDRVEMAGYSTATKAVMDSTRLQSLGWLPCYNIESGINRTLTILHKEGQML